MRRAVLLTLQIVILGLATSSAQEREITRDEFWAYMDRSNQVTSTTPVHASVAIETSDRPDRGWVPYSSWIEDRVFPRCSRITYTSSRKSDFIRIGRIRYANEGDGNWVRTVQDDQPSVSSPAAHFGYDGNVYQLASSGYSGEKSTVLRIVWTHKNETPESERAKSTSEYSFNGAGVLYRNQSISFNGRNWLRRTEHYEYNPQIRIDPPLGYMNGFDPDPGCTSQ